MEESCSDVIGDVTELAVWERDPALSLQLRRKKQRGAEWKRTN